MNIIFHHPLPINPKAKSASGIRPLQMLKAFQDLGCHVDIVAGYSKERKEAIKRIKYNIKKGKKYDFVYAESSTMPTMLTEPHHLPLHPLMDFLFFRYCKRQNIAIGLFYRDIYWRFKNYGKKLNPIKKTFAKLAYWFDLMVYENTLIKLYLPSLEMGSYIPAISPDKFSALPPGHINPSFEANEDNQTNDIKLKLFYVGGMSDHYQLHTLFEVLKEFPQIEFTLCTREEEWIAVKNEYPAQIKNITIIHKAGTEMEVHLRLCDIAVLYVKPQKYWEFAAPVKLYEYLGFQKPILASSGTLAGDFVSQNKAGWSLDYSSKALKDFFNNILRDNNIWMEIQNNLPKIAKQHSWEMRAKQVIKELAP